MLAISSIDIDASGKLWVAECSFLPRRVSVWNTDGTFCVTILAMLPILELMHGCMIVILLKAILREMNCPWIKRIINGRWRG